MGTLTEFDPAAAGFRVAATPIRRRKRRPSSRTAPKPQYADAVLYSFQNQTPLEVSVRTSAVEDTVRALKRAARYQERTTGEEVRVQISVEPVMVEVPKVEAGQPVVDGKGQPVMVLVPAKPAKSVVKFLGHTPWLLGRRISKARAEELGVAPEAVAADEAPATAPARHRRTVAGTRARHARASLRHAMVRAVITAGKPLVPVAGGLSFFLVDSRCILVIKPIDFLYHHRDSAGRVFPTGREAGRMRYYREYVEIADPGDGGPPYVAEVRLCHDFPRIEPTDSNTVVVFDERVELSDAWRGQDMPTETWAMMATG